MGLQMLRKPIVLMAILASALAAVALSAASASAAQRIDMKVLLLGTSTSEPDFAAWRAALQREGVPFEAIVTSPGHAPITAATLSDTLANGTQEAKYQALIVSVGALPECTESGCFSTLSAAEWTAIEEYEQTFHVRQITGDVFPGGGAGAAGYGLNAYTKGGEFAKGAESEEKLTTEGKTVFPYLNGPVTMDTGTYGYEAIPLSTQPTGASFHTLVEGPNKSALAGIYTHANGIEELVETFDQNQYQLQAELLRHGALNWVTRGVYFGDQRNYVEMDIDDTFSPDDAWNSTTHQNEYTNFAAALRIGPADVNYAAKWSEENHFRMDQLFNGGNSVVYQEEHSGPDPLLAEFQKTNPATGKPYASSFGWLSHTYDTPVMDVGCATQNYIEAELNQNTNWAAEKPGATPGTGGVGLTESTDPSVALGTENPQVFVPGNHSGFANLVPGNPATVDPPEFNDALPGGSGGTLPAGNYEYAITDQFIDSPSAGQTTASVTKTLEVKAGESVTLQWEAICHASDYLIYRELAGSNKWSLIDTVHTPQSATLPDSTSANPESTTNVKGGGETEQSFTDTGVSGTEEPGWTPPALNTAVESGWEQNPYFIPALQAVGITAVGADASKGYPNPPTAEFGIGANYSGPEYLPGETFLDGTAQVVPRHPINVYYNASTEAQEVDEYNTLYTPVSEGGECVASSTTTCETKPANFAEIVNDTVSGMFQKVMGNDPRPSYVHQTNLLGQPPPGPPTTGTPPNTKDTTGDGLLYSVLNPLLAEYHQYFASSAPYEQPTLGAISSVLAEQSTWQQALGAGQVSGYIEGNQVTINNSGAGAVNAPLTGVTGVGTSYGGITSGWTSVAAGASTHSAPTPWPAAPEPAQQEPQGSWFGKFGSSGYLLADWNGVQDASVLPSGVTATLKQGSRYQWAANTSDVRALQGPDGTTRSASTYYDPSEVKLQLSFTSAYSGNLHLYAVDWDSTARNETITVDDGSGPRSVVLSSFHEGDWVSLPINVPAAGALSITVHNNAGANAVVSGVFLGESGNPPTNVPAELSKGSWVNGFGHEGYDLAGWDGPAGDVSYIPNATVALLQGSRYQWAAQTTDARALQEPGELTRNAAAYYDPNQIAVTLGFNSEFNGNIHLYAVDWDSTARRETISVNGQTAVLSSSFHEGAWVSFPVHVKAGEKLRITVDRTAGANAVLSGIFVGETGAPPGPTVETAPQGSWTGAVGHEGYDLAGWGNSAEDVSDLPASVSLVKGTRYQWTAGTTEAKALTDPTGGTRNAGAYYDPNEIQLQLTFNQAFAGNLHLYALDWDHGTRREIITVRGKSVVLSKDFSEGAWVTFENLNVAAGGSLTITVDRTFGPNAVLSGIFLGGSGAPYGPTASSSPQGNWVGTHGAEGYDLFAFNGETDASSLPHESMTVEKGTRFQWASSTTEQQGLESADTKARAAAALYDLNEIKLQLTFTTAYTGNLELYAVDWDSTARRELISVNGQVAALSSAFNNGAWVSVPISVKAGESVTITVSRIAGANAVLSGVFLE